MIHTTTLYFIFPTGRHVIVKSNNEGYCYCTIRGGEKHRLIVSSEGPFDINLPVDNAIWKKHEVKVDEFLKAIDMNPVQLLEHFTTRFNSWHVSIDLFRN